MDKLFGEDYPFLLTETQILNCDDYDLPYYKWTICWFMLKENMIEVPNYKPKKIIIE